MSKSTSNLTSKDANKNLNYYLNLAYPFTVRPDLDDGGFVVEFPDLRYCVGTGDTIEEAINDSMIAKSEWIKAAFENRITIPEPSSNEDYNGRISLRIPRSLHRKIVETAKQEGVSANQFLSHLISIGMGKKSI
ncbi:HicB family protein [Pelotomaculum schinkii]|uniref:HicB family protein n=1 Tax=Pelotomaculum schinkii TaxID=78350 RepID=A0A4Y7RGD4_9FIRM|nr:toxin-antitoxin system HicB family antitoxin [Pelotomaculum schinkii]TEB07810.1 HicB family protein [Pelotomaculum schinkii]